MPSMDKGSNLFNRCQVFVELGLLSAAELEEVLVTEFNPVRMGFEGSTEIITHDVLNCGGSSKPHGGAGEADIPGGWRVSALLCR